MRPDGTHLGNWREWPRNQWTFHHVRDLIPTARIGHDPATTSALEVAASDHLDSPGLEQTLRDTWTDGFLVLHKQKIVLEWVAPHYDDSEPHILFSVSKSITATLAGVLVEQGLLDVDASVVNYIPDAAGSAWEGCSIRHVLDMQVGLNFAEVYTGENEQFNRYRAATGWNLTEPGGIATNLRSFLTTLTPGLSPHGGVFRYLSPNSDMLGLILEAASGDSLSNLFSKFLWQPMGAEADAYITVDREGSPRAAGGICVRLRDLARFARMICQQGRVGSRQVIPEFWIDDIMHAGSFDAWEKGNTEFNILPGGRYRNQWYQSDNTDGAICAIGIHGQWIYIDPLKDIVIVKVSSQPAPLDVDLELKLLNLYVEICGLF